MKTSIINLALAALLAPLSGVQQISSATQAPPAQAQPAATSTAPCVKAPATPQRKPGWLETKAKKLACAHDKNLCDLPSSIPEITGETPEAKPCPATPAPTPVPPAKAQPQAPTPATPGPAAATSNKPAMVCPPHTTLIPNTPYCLTADKTTVDAIPLPPGMSAPAPAAKATTTTTTPHE